MNEIIFMVEEAPEGGFTAHALGVPVFTEADDLDDLYRRVRDAVCCHFKAEERPQVIRLSPKSSEKATTH
ncbi:MAG TPA: 2-oxoisovalerate dehydrogenase [Armatimonadota bacterium]|nr:2-oxoisovalerate dehydrogenase [Armatimonadota bacterium]